MSWGCRRGVGGSGEGATGRGGGKTGIAPELKNSWLLNSVSTLKHHYPPSLAPTFPGKGKRIMAPLKKCAAQFLTEYPQSCQTRNEPGAGAEIPVRNEPGRGLSEVRPVLVGSDLPEIHSKILSESARLRLLQFTLVDSGRDVCRPQRLLRRPRARRK